MQMRTSDAMQTVPPTAHSDRGPNPCAAPAPGSQQTAAAPGAATSPTVTTLSLAELLAQAGFAEEDKDELEAADVEQVPCHIPQAFGNCAIKANTAVCNTHARTPARTHACTHARTLARSHARSHARLHAHTHTHTGEVLSPVEMT